MPRFVVALSAMLLALLAASTAQATSALALTTPEQAALSAAVVLATVGTATQEVHPTLGRPVTVTELRIERVLLGSAPETVGVRQWRGELDGRTSFVPGDPALEPGARLVVFLRQVDGRWFLTALSQSVFHVDADLGLDREVDVALFTRGLEGRLVPLAGPLDEPASVRSLEASLREVIPRGPETTP